MKYLFCQEPHTLCNVARRWARLHILCWGERKLSTLHEPTRLWSFSILRWVFRASPLFASTVSWWIGLWSSAMVARLWSPSSNGQLAQIETGHSEDCNGKEQDALFFWGKDLQVVTDWNCLTSTWKCKGFHCNAKGEREFRFDYRKLRIFEGRRGSMCYGL